MISKSNVDISFTQNLYFIPVDPDAVVSLSLN